MTDTKLLLQYIQNSGLKKTKIAETLDISMFTLKRKIENETEFKQSEIQKLCELLSIKTAAEKESIFFAQKSDSKSALHKKEVTT